MNVERIAELVKRLMQADKVIAEQQLGYMWFPPTEDIFQLELDTIEGEKLSEFLKPSKSKFRQTMICNFDCQDCPRENP